jgi:hypothetical protein
MDVNKIKIVESPGEKNIVVPLSINFDLLDREASILEQETDIIKEVIGEPLNYELSRFAHVTSPGGSSSLTYDFRFTTSTGDTLNPLALTEISYLSKFTENQIRYNSNAFKNSFFKLDFYDSMDPKTQKIYFSVILRAEESVLDVPVCLEYRIIVFQAGLGTLTYVDCCNRTQVWTKTTIGDFFDFCPSPNSTATYVSDFEGELFTYSFFFNGGSYDVDNIIISPSSDQCRCQAEDLDELNPLKLPSFLLDYDKTQEGYFIYWYESLSLLNLSNLYMTTKFFNAATGEYIKFIKNEQINYSNPYRIPNQDYYYVVYFNYDTKEYTIYTTDTYEQVNVVTWYEYVNPPLA